MEDSVFETSLDNDEILFDSQDYSDVVEKSVKRKNINKIIIIGIILFLIIIAAYMLYATIFTTKEIAEDEYNISQLEEEYQQSSDYIANIKAPLLELYPNAPIVETKQILTEVKEGSLIAGTNKLTIKEISITAAINPCEVLNPTDFCLAGTAKFMEMPINIYFMNDLVRSRLFENPDEFKELTITGSPASGSIIIKIAGEEGVVLAIANKDSSGFMIAVPEEMTIQQIEELAKLITISTISNS